jgi:hypothetical protein
MPKLPLILAYNRLFFSAGMFILPKKNKRTWGKFDANFGMLGIGLKYKFYDKLSSEF